MLHLVSSFFIFAVLICSVFSFSLFAAAKNTAPEKQPAGANQDFPESVLKASAAASLAWLGIVDKNRYAESWDKASALTKMTVNKDDWVQILEKTRRPLGSVTSREVMDQRTAKDPSGLPKGDYIVMFYKTVFAHKTGFELVTLYLEDGQWTVLTYQVNTQ